MSLSRPLSRPDFDALRALVRQTPEHHVPAATIERFERAGYIEIVHVQGVGTMYHWTKKTRAMVAAVPAKQIPTLYGVLTALVAGCGCSGADFRVDPFVYADAAGAIDARDGREAAAGDETPLVDAAPLSSPEASADAGVGDETSPMDAAAIDASPGAGGDAGLAPEVRGPAVCCELNPPSAMREPCGSWTCAAGACGDCAIGDACHWTDPQTGDGWLGRVVVCMP
jgi:hypothetical protein